ncbi:ABC transporter permease [Paenactinomyces guangxiensis]|uniref:ABC transporter permease n=1 Tax=Paenactinomyces guangxiensis TaxID=1490290 RepID=A0A7W1WPG8_9BACL|nr:ABC transporter permease [Paenactinomyces guangxiensis]MBH8590892.1 ABC transporter permease [Paenactinomyces guangxiensis]
MEHQSNTWKLIFSMPVSKLQFYWSKCLWLVTGTLLSGIVLMAGFYQAGVILGASDSLNWMRLFSYTAYPYLGSFALMGVQLWLSMVVKNQSVSIIAGGAGALAGLYFIQVPGWPQYTPWAIPYQLNFARDNIINDFASISQSPHLEWHWVGISALMGLLLFLLGSVHFARKETE